MRARPAVARPAVLPVRRCLPVRRRAGAPGEAGMSGGASACGEDGPPGRGSRRAARVAGPGRGNAQPGRGARQPGERERTGRGAGQRGHDILQAGARPVQGGVQADEGEDRESPQAGRQPSHRQRPDPRRIQGEYHQDAAEQGGLVAGTERRDGEVLDGQRREVDGGLADREHRRALRDGQPGGELGRADRDRCREHAGEGSGERARSPGLVTVGGGRWCHGGSRG